VDEFLAVLEAADQLDFGRHRPTTLDGTRTVRALRDDAGLEWNTVATRLGIAPGTALYLYGRSDETAQHGCGVRRALLATLASPGCA